MCIEPCTSVLDYLHHSSRRGNCKGQQETEMIIKVEVRIQALLASVETIYELGIPLSEVPKE
jgi:hypothetical protein